jgi:hypothetical protein
MHLFVKLLTWGFTAMVLVVLMVATLRNSGRQQDGPLYICREIEKRVLNNNDPWFKEVSSPHLGPFGLGVNPLTSGEVRSREK